jgi:hypothetical protein
VSLGVRTMPKHHTFLCLSKQLRLSSPRDRLINCPSGLLVPSVQVNSAWPVLGIPSRTGIPLRLHLDWTGTGTNNLAVVG